MDVWCIGILAYEILIGKKPFQTDIGLTSTVRKILQVFFFLYSVNLKFLLKKKAFANNSLTWLLKEIQKTEPPFSKLKKLGLLNLKFLVPF
jgi:hypothetical protein